MKMIIKEFKNNKTFLEESLQFFSQSINSAKTYIALSGGFTPKPFYEYLANSSLDLSQVNLYLVDERYVSTDYSESNFNMIYHSLFTHKQIGSLSFFDTSLEIADALKTYNEKLLLVPNQIFDLIILGIGQDGHIASLFPNSLESFDESQLTAHTQTKIFNVKDRLTITPAVILKAKKILILLKGEEKKELIEELINGRKDIKEFPAKLLKSHPHTTLHYLQD